MARLLTGTLFLPDGSPLANATIYLTSKRNEMAGILKGLDGAFTTNAGGHYTQNVQEGFYQVSLSHPLAGNSSRRWNLGNIQVGAGAATSINELLQFSEDAQNPIANEIQQMYEQIIAARDAAQLSATAAGTSATAASASATSASGSATAAAGAATTATTKAGEATTAATTATGAATTATTKAGEATTAAGTATGAATTATTKAGEASTSATAAAGSASSAATSAASVDGVVTAAESARDDAIAAKNVSEDAAIASVSAADTAIAKAGEATTAAGTATGAATTATAKAGDASASAAAAADSASSAAASASSVGSVVTDAVAAKNASEAAAAEAALSRNIAMQFAQNDEDVPVTDADGNPIGFSSKHYAKKSEASAGGGVTPSTELSFLSAKQGGAFGPASTLAQALQSLVDVGVGAIASSDQALDDLASFDDLWVIPRGKSFLVAGGSASASFLVSLTAGTTYPYALGNANTRDLLVKVGAMEWTVSGTTYKKIVFQYRGQGTTSSNVGIQRFLGVTKNMTTAAVTCLTQQLADFSSIPSNQTFNGSHVSSWVSGKSAKIGAFNFLFSKLSSSRSASLSGGVTVSSDISANSRENLFFGVVSTDIVAVDAAAVFFRPFTNDTAFGTTIAIFPLSDPSSANSTMAELVFEWYLDGGVTKVSMGIINRSANVLPASSYVFSGGHATQ